MIDVTGVDLVKFAQKVYELSVPQGLGFLHFTPKPLSDEEAKELICNGELDMDYVHGRACKMNVRDNKINDAWYDHTDDQLKELLDAFGIKAKTAAAHGYACNCTKCQTRRD